jgi:hypothetical protein
MCAKRERLWSLFAQLWVCWANEDVKSFEGVYVTPSPNWNLAYGGPCAYYEISVEGLVPPWLLRVGYTNI